MSDILAQLIFAGIALALNAWGLSWLILALVEMAHLKRRYRPWQDWTIYFRRDN